MSDQSPGRYEYAHMCRDEHVQIGHNDSEDDWCPLCRALARVKELEAELKVAHGPEHYHNSPDCLMVPGCLTCSLKARVAELENGWVHVYCPRCNSPVRSVFLRAVSQVPVPAALFVCTWCLKPMLATDKEPVPRNSEPSEPTGSATPNYPASQTQENEP